MYKMDINLSELQTMKSVRKEIENQFQCFVHSVNHLSRSACESPFTNVSIFDRPKLKKLISEMDFMFQIPKDDNANHSLNYIIDYVMELQKIFIEFFDKGDPTKNGMPYRFPVCTTNISIEKNDKEEYEILDKEFLDYICSRDIYRYNIFVSESQKTASCCFHPSQKITIKNKEGNIRVLTFKELVDNIKNISDLKIYHMGDWKKFEKVKVKYDKPFYKITTEFNHELIVTEDHLHPIYDPKSNTFKKGVKTIDLDTSHYLKCCVVKPTDDEDIKIVHDCLGMVMTIKIKSIEEYKNDIGYAYCVNIINDEPYFTLTNGIITHNCRLLSDSEMMELASQSNSFGGSSISIGSHRVCTINFMRVAMESKSEEEFFKILDERIESTAKILNAHKELIKDLKNKGLQQFISNGWINFTRLFSTFGILGIYEASKLFKQKFGNHRDAEGLMLKFMNDKVEEYSKKYGIIGNIEQIPGESFAVRLAKADKLIYGEVNIPYKLYANQFIPLWEDATIWEKLKADGKYNRLITGGGIVHATIGEKVTATQAKQIIEYAVKCGCEHFALNAIYSECENKHVHFGDIQVCPTCNGQIVEKRTRVVGFFTPVSSWNPIRREWEFPRRTKVRF